MRSFCEKSRGDRDRQNISVDNTNILDVVWHSWRWSEDETMMALKLEQSRKRITIEVWLFEYIKPIFNILKVVHTGIHNRVEVTLNTYNVDGFPTNYSHTRFDLELPRIVFFQKIVSLLPRLYLYGYSIARIRKYSNSWRVAKTHSVPFLSLDLINFLEHILYDLPTSIPSKYVIGLLLVYLYDCSALLWKF